MPLGIIASLNPDGWRRQGFTFLITVFDNLLRVQKPHTLQLFLLQTWLLVELHAVGDEQLSTKALCLPLAAFKSSNFHSWLSSSKSNIFMH